MNDEPLTLTETIKGGIAFALLVFKVVFILALLSALAGCGGGDSDNGTPTPEPTPDPTPAPDPANTPLAPAEARAVLAQYEHFTVAYDSSEGYAPFAVHIDAEGMTIGALKSVPQNPGGNDEYVPVPVEVFIDEQGVIRAYGRLVFDTIMPDFLTNSRRVEYLASITSLADGQLYVMSSQYRYSPTADSTLDDITWQIQSFSYVWNGNTFLPEGVQPQPTNDG